MPIPSECWSQISVFTKIVPTLHMLPTIAKAVAEIMFRNKKDKKLIPKPATQERMRATMQPVDHVEALRMRVSSKAMNMIARKGTESTF